MRHSWKETNLSHPCRTSWTPNEVFLRDCQTLPCWLPTWTPGRKELKWKEQPLLIIRWLHRSIWRISKKVKLQWGANYLEIDLATFVRVKPFKIWIYQKYFFANFSFIFFFGKSYLAKIWSTKVFALAPDKTALNISIHIFYIRIYYYTLCIKIYY